MFWVELVVWWLLFVTITSFLEVFYRIYTQADLETKWSTRAGGSLIAGLVTLAMWLLATRELGWW